MLIKLMKHEWKGTYKTFLLMYGILLLLSISMVIGIQIKSDWLIQITVGLMGLSMFAVCLGYGVMVFWRYNKNLYGSEGYLMFTLPVSGWQLLASKLLTSVLWGILTVIVGLFCGGIILIPAISYNEAGFYKIFMDQLWQAIHFVGMDNIILGIFIILAGVIASILEVYFIITAVHLPFITRGRVIIGLLLTYVLDKIQTFLMTNLAPRGLKEAVVALVNNSSPSAMEMIQVYRSGGLFILFVMILLGAIYFAATTFILSKKVSIK